MKFFGKITFLLIIAVLLLYFTSEAEARGGRGGGGGRGGSRGGSRGSSRGGGWFSRGGSGKSSVGYGGGYKSGGYASFGSPSRWSNVGGRRIYYVGYYHGHHYHGGHRYGSSGNPYEGQEDMNPWMVMLFCLLGLFGMGFVIWLAVYIYLKNCN